MSTEGLSGSAVRRSWQRGVEASDQTRELIAERELQAARLVADGKTNPEIAPQLFLSHKTVETHIRNIFRKRDVASRVELARAVERTDQSVVSRVSYLIKSSSPWQWRQAPDQPQWPNASELATTP
jgi:DNA-binding CsgD family transcriptional regulator